MELNKMQKTFNKFMIHNLIFNIKFNHVNFSKK